MASKYSLKDSKFQCSFHVSINDAENERWTNIQKHQSALGKENSLDGMSYVFSPNSVQKKCPPILLTWAIETPTLLPPKSPDFHLFRPPRWRPYRCHGFFRAQMELAPTGSWWIYEPVDGSEIGPKKTPPFGDAFWNRSDVVGSYFTSTLKPLVFNRAENLQEWLSSLQLPTAEVVSWCGVKVGKGWANKVCGGCGGWDLFCQPWIFILSINLWVISSNIKDPNQKIL